MIEIIGPFCFVVALSAPWVVVAVMWSRVNRRCSHKRIPFDSPFLTVAWYEPDGSKVRRHIEMCQHCSVLYCSFEDVDVGHG